MTREDACELAGDDKLLFMDGHDDCLIGVAFRASGVPIAAYDMGKIVKHHIADGMTQPQAWEYFEFNQLGAYMGEYTPAFIQKPGD